MIRIRYEKSPTGNLISTKSVSTSSGDVWARIIPVTSFSGGFNVEIFTSTDTVLLCGTTKTDALAKKLAKKLLTDLGVVFSAETRVTRPVVDQADYVMSQAS